MSKDNICDVYATQPLLKGIRTQYDLDAIKLYCANAQRMDYGPSSAGVSKVQPCTCPYGYAQGLNQAYAFSSGPQFMDLGQALNYQTISEGYRATPYKGYAPSAPRRSA